MLGGPNYTLRDSERCVWFYTASFEEGAARALFHSHRGDDYGVYMCCIDLIFLGSAAQALLPDVGGLGCAKQEIRDGRNRPEGLEHLGAVLGCG